MSGKNNSCGCLICRENLGEDILQFDADVAVSACREHIANYDDGSMYVQAGISGNMVVSGMELKDNGHCPNCNDTGIYTERVDSVDDSDDGPFDLEVVCGCLYENAVHVTPCGNSL